MSKIEVILILIACLICFFIRAETHAEGGPHSLKLQECNFKDYNNYDKSYYYKNDKIIVYWNTNNNKACFIKQA
jgi:hypothetical protein